MIFTAETQSTRRFVIFVINFTAEAQRARRFFSLKLEIQSYIFSSAYSASLRFIFITAEARRVRRVLFIFSVFFSVSSVPLR